MTNTMTLTGMVTATCPIGDYDRRLTILTKEMGKISAFAKGARKPNSALLACSQPFVFGRFDIYAGRSSYNITSVEVSNYFPELRADLNKIYYGMYFCEFTDYYTRENNDEVEVLKLLYHSLKALSNEYIGIRLVRRIFELKLIALEGEGPNMFECRYCGGEKITAYNVNEDGGICDDCYTGMLQVTAPELTAVTALQPSSVYTMQYILNSSVEKLYTFTVTKDVLKEIEAVVELHKNKHVERHMNSESMLDII